MTLRKGHFLSFSEGQSYFLPRCQGGESSLSSFLISTCICKKGPSSFSLIGSLPTLVLGQRGAGRRGGMVLGQACLRGIHGLVNSRPLVTSLVSRMGRRTAVNLLETSVSWVGELWAVMGGQLRPQTKDTAELDKQASKPRETSGSWTSSMKRFQTCTNPHRADRLMSMSHARRYHHSPSPSLLPNTREAKEGPGGRGEQRPLTNSGSLATEVTTGLASAGKTGEELYVD